MALKRLGSGERHDGSLDPIGSSRANLGWRSRRGATAPSLALLSLLPSLAAAQAPSPYAGQEAREIKSLSEEELHALEAGEGMGLARPAELNGYPGPKHVLELAEELSLSESQRASVQRSFESMRETARREGRALVAAERALDALFASGAVEPGPLSAAVERAAAARSRLRLAHLAAHLETRAVLRQEQVHAYVRLRGYASGHHGGAHH